MMKKMLENVRNNSPLVHSITNYVTVNDCANMLLACGAAPIMADDEAEVEEITSICNTLYINIGTLNKRTIDSMILAGKKSNELGHPVILDPVGAGASSLRTNTCYELMENIRFSVIRGNISEIKTLAAGSGTTKGVDADASDMITEDTLESTVQFAKAFSAKTGAIIIITGATDIVADEKKAYILKNGRAEMGRITGTGCMLSAIVAAYIAANPENPLDACAAAVSSMGLCGELAFDRLPDGGGNSTYRNNIIDDIYNLTGEVLEKGAVYEIR